MKRTLLIAVLVLAASLPAQAQVNSATPGWFPFTFPGYDSSPTAIDLSYLNEKPAGRSGFLRAQDGVIRDRAGRRVRWFGVNFANGANFPDKTLAPVLAARMAKMGVNLVGLFAVDTPGLLINAANTGIDYATLDKLDFFIAELKKQGIYVSLNLHVTRTYPGTPSAYPYSRGLDLFYPPYIDALKQFARGLLTHFDPYTGSVYAQEPAITSIEVGSEDTLGMYSPVHLASLPEPFASELRKQWIAWLRAKYGTTDALRAAWGGNDGQYGPNLIPNPDFANNAQGWTFINNPGGASFLAPIPDGTPGIRWTVTRTGSQSWSERIYALRLNLAEGQPYRLQLRARADAPHPLTVAVELDEDYKPGVIVGLWTLANLTTSWQNLSYTFTATGTVPNHVMVILDPQIDYGVLDLAGVSLQRVPGGVLQPDQTLENGNIPFTASATNPTAQRDFTEFLIDTERSTTQEIHRFLKQDLGVQQMIYQGEVKFGGMAGAIREARVSDLANTDGFWQHPQFPGQLGDAINWFIPNTSQIADPTGGVLAEMAIQRVAGMPFTISGYNTPAPNDFSAETWPLLSTMASFQDWDGVYFFCYAAQHTDYNSDHILGYFTLQGHPAQEAFTPLAALLFRTGMVHPAVQSVVLTAAEQPIVADQTTGAIWNSFDRFWAQVGLPPTVALLHRTAVSVVPGNAATQVSSLPTLPASGPITSDTGEIVWDAAQQVMTLNAPAVRLLLGSLGGKSISVGDVGFQITSPSGRDHAHLGLIALDGQPIAASRQLLLVALGRAENQNMGWNAARTSVGNQWGTGPAVVQGVSGAVTLPGAWNVVTLDPTGAPVRTVATGVSSFRIEPSYGTVWYLLSRSP